MLSPQRFYVHLRAVIAEMAYANNRRLELQTGWVLTSETAYRRARAQTARLEWAFTQDAAPDVVLGPVLKPDAAGPPSVEASGLRSREPHQGAKAPGVLSAQQRPTGL